MKKSRFITYIVFITVIILLWLNSSKLIFGINGIENSFENSESDIPQEVILYADELIPELTDEDTMKYNTDYLQCLIDEISSIGGGTVKIPAGTFFFASDNLNSLGTESYIIKCKDNVTISGEGVSETTGTVLKPIRTSEYDLTMFYYNDYEDSNGSNTECLENADFNNFIINCENTIDQTYNSLVNGFKLNLNKNCDWLLINVEYVTGSGFKINNPIGSTLTNCIASDGGKNSIETDISASGFEICTGYNTNSTILIKECASLGNTGYGYYFENRNSDLYTVNENSGINISNCISSGNLYDYGGINAYNVTIENTGSYTDYDTGSNKLGFYFDETSKRINIVNCFIGRVFSDVSDSSVEYYEPVYWAVNNGIAERIGDDLFEPLKECTKKEVIEFLWKMSGRATDIEYIEWAVEIGLIQSIDEETDDICTINDAITLLWKYAGSPVVEDGFSYEDSINWALSLGIIDDVENLLNQNITRADVLTFLYKFSNSNSEFGITYNLMGGTLESKNPEKYISGTDNFVLNSPIKEGYTFIGWSGSNCDNIGNMNTSFVPETNVEITKLDVGNKVYIANWIPNTYTIKFDSNGGSGEMSNQEFTYDVSKSLLLNEFLKQGYEFKEWNTEKDGTGITLSNTEAVINLTNVNNEEIILYAQWEMADLENRKNIFIGDSLIDEMKNIVGEEDTWITNRDGGLDWLKEQLSDIEGEIDDNTNIIIRIGINDLFSNYLVNGNVDIDYVVQKYSRYLNVEVLKLSRLGAKVYFVSIGPFDDNKTANENINNDNASLFNTKLSESLRGTEYIDLYSEIIDEINLKNPDFTKEDGIHGVPISYSMQYKAIKEFLGQEYIATYESFINMTDCSEEDDFYEAVKWGYENVYIDPITENEFGPNEIITNSEVISLLWRYQGIPYVIPNNFIYTDVTENDLYYDAVVWGLEKGIIGDTTNIFNPNVACTKSEFIMLLWKMAGSKIVNTGNEFTDVEVGSEYENAINWALNKGIIKEELNDEFLPNSNCTREMAIKFLYNYHYRYAEQYTVKYDYETNGGIEAECDEEELFYGDEVNLEVSASKPGYEFIGWNTDSKATTRLASLNIKGEDITLYAIFKKDIKVTFIDYNGTEKVETVKNITIYNNEFGNVKAIDMNTYSNWIPKHWVYENSFDISIADVLPGEELNGLVEDITLYGIYANDITIKFNLNNGMGILPENITSTIYKNSENIELTKEAEVEIPSANLVKDYFDFSGWNTRVGGEGETFECGNFGYFTSDITLYARWVAQDEFPFKDISPDAWCYEAVKFVYNRGYILGFTNIRYGPEAKLTRGMIVTILNRMEGYNFVDAECKYTDVDEDEFYYESVKWATEMGIVQGYVDGTFRPDKPITREELAIVLRNYTKYKNEEVNLTADLSRFNDGDTVSDFALSAVEWAVAAGVITGYEDTNTIRPQGSATRDVVASMLYKYCKSYITDY